MNNRVNPVTFSKAEKRIMDYVVSASGNAEGDGSIRFTLECIVAEFHPDGDAPAHAASAMARRLRLLSLKTAAVGVPGPVRVTPVGRGHKAVYEWRGLSD